MNKQQINALARKLHNDIIKENQELSLKKSELVYDELYKEWEPKIKELIYFWENCKMTIDTMSIVIEIEDRKFFSYQTKCEDIIKWCQRTIKLYCLEKFKNPVPTFQDIADDILIASIDNQNLSELSDIIINKYKQI